jgi:hypothetical protein
MAVAAGVVGNFFLSATATLPNVASEDASPAIDDVPDDFVLSRA